MMKLTSTPEKGFATLTVTLMLMAVVAVSILGYGAMVNSMVLTNQDRIRYLENKNISQSGIACAVSWIKNNNISNTSDVIVDCGNLVKIKPINKLGSVFHSIESYSYNQESDKDHIGTVFASQAVIVSKGYSTAPDAGLIAGGDVDFTVNGSSNASSDMTAYTPPHTAAPFPPSGVISSGQAKVCKPPLTSEQVRLCAQYNLANKESVTFNGGSPSSHYLSGLNKNVFDIQVSSCEQLPIDLNNKSIWIELGAGASSCAFKTSSMNNVLLVISKSKGNESVTLTTAPAGVAMTVDGLMAFIDSRPKPVSEQLSLKFDFRGSLVIRGSFISDAKVSNGDGAFTLYYDYHKLLDVEKKIDIGAMAMKGTWYDFYQ